MNTEVYWIPGPWQGRLGIVARPRGGDWLQDEVQGWRAAGVNVVVSLLTDDEVSELQLEQEERRCREEGIAFLSLPIPDRGVPAAADKMADLVGAIARAVDSGESVAVHCRQGIGRSALVVALVMAAFGEEPASAFQTIASARGRPVPDTEEQRDWAERFARDLAVPSRRSVHGQPSFAHEASSPYERARPASADGDAAAETDAQRDTPETAGRGTKDG